MTNESLVIYSMTKVGRLIPISNKMILRDITLGFYYGAKIGMSYIALGEFVINI